MENALLIGLSRQTALQRQLDVIANNMANVDTAGFRNERMEFAEYLMPVAEASGFRRGDRTLSYVQDSTLLNDFSAGPLRTTGNPLDVAIDGEGWFAVETEDGERYTRAGAFTLDREGRLTTATGALVMGQAGPISFTAEETDITIAADGTISSSAGQKDRLRLVRFADEQRLERAGDTLFAGQDPLPVENARVLQGALEGSNVRAVLQIAEMIEVTRAYTTLAKTQSDTDELRRTAINKLGRLEG